MAVSEAKKQKPGPKARPILAAWRLGAVAVVIFGIDRLSKIIIVEALDLANVGRMEIYPPYLVFVMAWNEGINFGIPLGGPVFLVALAVVISVVLTWWLIRRGSGELGIYGGLVVGGAIGNAWDRVQYGAVADFLNMSCCGIVNPFAFNVADIAIFLGAVLIAIRA